MPVVRLSGIRCYNMGHNGHEITLHGILIILRIPWEVDIHGVLRDFVVLHRTYLWPGVPGEGT